MTQGIPSWLSPSGPARLRLALVLLAMCAALLAGKLLEESLIERLRHDTASLFADRLMPATTLFHLSDQMHLKRHALEQHLDGVGDGDLGALRYRLGQHDARLEMLTRQFGQTYLVEDESRHLQGFREALTAYQAAEQDLLQRVQAGDDVHYGAEMRADFAAVRGRLLSLTEVQQTVGQELLDESTVLDESTESASGVTSLLYFQLGVAFVLGLLASGLAMGLARKAPQPPPDPRLH